MEGQLPDSAIKDLHTSFIQHTVNTRLRTLLHSERASHSEPAAKESEKKAWREARTAPTGRYTRAYLPTLNISLQDKISCNNQQQMAPYTSQTYHFTSKCKTQILAEFAEQQDI